MLDINKPSPATPRRIYFQFTNPTHYNANEDLVQKVIRKFKIFFKPKCIAAIRDGAILSFRSGKIHARAHTHYSLKAKQKSLTKKFSSYITI